MPQAFAHLFEKAQRGDRIAVEAFYRLVSYRLKGIASALLRRERRGHTLQATALVNELYLKLRRMEMRILDEEHFYRLSARAMRQVLIDHKRIRKSGTKVPLHEIPEMLSISVEQADHDETILAVRMAFEKLKRMDSQVAETVWLRSVEGLTLEEMSGRQGREMWRVRADYDFGLKWMESRLSR